jgi:hypothetical protein
MFKKVGTPENLTSYHFITALTKLILQNTNSIFIGEDNVPTVKLINASNPVEESPFEQT